MYLLVIFLPFFSAFINGFFGRFWGTKGVQIISVSCLSVTLLTSLFICYEVVFLGSICTLKLFSWFNVGFFFVNWAFLFDAIGAIMLVVVSCVSLLVHIYAIEYMKGDPFVARFFAYLSFFTGFMIILVTADNFLQLFLGWEGVGLVSYLLINFWYTIVDANKAALKAIIVNRIGDIGVALGVSLLYIQFKSIEFNVVFPIASYYASEYAFFGLSISKLDVICLLFFIGSIGKSAQLGLHTWLPDAMAGPTPVSALIHAATMVTAGVFLLIRISPLLEYTEVILLAVTFLGAMTSFFAASVGLFQNDLKKIIAYSTCSQLGYMVFICGLSNYSLSLFHLTNHAFFKALLFLSAGSVIHALNDEQDIRKMGGLIQILPFTYLMILIGSLALMGIPFLTGFYSKDIIIETAYVAYNIRGSFFYWLSVIAALFTSFYSFRLIYYTFFTKANTYKILIENTHECSILMAVPLLVLSVNSIFFGYVFKDVFIGLGTDVWQNSVIVNKKNLLFLESEFLSASIKNIPLFFSLAGVVLVFCLNSLRMGALIFRLKSKFFLFLKKIWSFFSYKWYFDVLYNKYIVSCFFNISYKNVSLIDRGLIEIFGPLGFVRSINHMSKLLNGLETGYIFHYLLISILLLLTVFLSKLVFSASLCYELFLLFLCYLILGNLFPANKKNN